MLAGGLTLSACSGDDDDTSVPPGADAGLDATRSDATATGDAGADAAADAAADTGPGSDSATDAGIASNVLYTMSNDPTTGKNAVFTYHRSTTDGTLTPVTGSPFLTGGTGIANPMQALGPDDSDYQLVTSADHKHLYAANGGSDTISVFDINADGSLTTLAASPFSSGGKSPVSMAFAGSYLLVTNQDADPGRGLTGANANYATLAIAADGSLSAATGVTAQPAGVSAASIITTADGTLAFADEFNFASGATPGLRAFTVGPSGALTKAPGDVYSIPADDGGPDGGIQNDQLVLGLGLNPVNKVLYVNYVIRSEISAWSYDSTGALTVHGSAKVSGGAPCWNRVSKDGKFLYVTDTALDQVSVLSISTDGLTLQEIQIFTLSNPGPTLVDAGGNTGHTASESYDEEISPDGKFLYVDSERLSNDTTYTEGNMLHVLAIDPTTGKLSENRDRDRARPRGGRADPPPALEGLVVF